MFWQAKKSHLCTLSAAEFLDLKNFLSSLKHPHVQEVELVTYMNTGTDGQVIVKQPFRKLGSLRDIIHGKVSGYDLIL